MRQKTFLWGLLVLFACGSKGEGQKPSTSPPAASTPTQTSRAKGPATEASLAASSRILALVNGEEIKEDFFVARLGRYVRPGVRIPEERLNKVKSTILERIIDDRLILQAARRDGISVSAAELAAEFEEHRGRFKSPRHFEQHLQQSGLTEDLIQQEIRVRVTLKKLLKKRGLVGIGEEDARAFYEKNSSLYQDRDSVHAAHILVRLERNADAATEEVAQKRLAEIQAVLKSGRDFKEVATEMSEGPSKSRGGDLGFFRRGQMVRAFEEAAFAMKTGEVSAPVRSHFGWHIIKVFAKKEGEKRGFEDVKDELIQSLTRKKVITEKRGLIKDLRASSDIKTLVDF